MKRLGIEVMVCCLVLAVAVALAQQTSSGLTVSGPLVANGPNYLESPVPGGSPAVTLYDYLVGQPGHILSIQTGFGGSSNGNASIALSAYGGAPANGLAFTVNALPGLALAANGGTSLPAYAVASLPACNAGSKYQLFSVSDASAPTYGATLSGGGTVAALAFCNGANWIAH